MLSHDVNPHQNPNALHVDSGVVWSPGVADTSDVFWFAADVRFISRQLWDEACYSPQ